MRSAALLVLGIAWATFMGYALGNLVHGCGRAMDAAYGGP